MANQQFVTPDGIAVPAVSAEQMREIDRITVEETGPTLIQMMENAGRTLAVMAMRVLGADWPGATVVTLSGSGGNGGGAICAARHLLNRGLSVLLCLALPWDLSEVARFQRRIFQSAGGSELDPQSLPVRPGLILDGLIGYGLKSAPRGETAELIRWANRTGAPILSLDLPSGIDATTGATPGEFIKARWTVTLGLPKTGLRSEHAGALFLADIGIPPAVYRRMGLDYTVPFGNRFLVPLKRG